MGGAETPEPKDDSFPRTVSQRAALSQLAPCRCSALRTGASALPLSSDCKAGGTSRQLSWVFATGHQVLRHRHLEGTRRRRRTAESLRVQFLHPSLRPFISAPFLILHVLKEFLHWPSKELHWWGFFLHWLPEVGSTGNAGAFPDSRGISVY